MRSSSEFRLSEEEGRKLTRETVAYYKRKSSCFDEYYRTNYKGCNCVSKSCRKDGAIDLIMLPPMRYKASDAEIVTYFRTVANGTSLPIMIYNNPVDYKLLVTLDMFQELLDACPNIQAVKESTRDIMNISRIKNRFGDRLAVMASVDTLALESSVLVADGWVAGLVDAFPVETVTIYELVKSGRINEAINIY